MRKRQSLPEPWPFKPLLWDEGLLCIAVARWDQSATLVTYWAGQLCLVLAARSLTLPKEVSLFAEGHREEAKGAIYAAVQSALDRSFTGLRYSAVAAIHTRNQVGQIHYHVHVLVAQFAQDHNMGSTVSLNSTASRNGPARIRDLKAGWQEGIERSFASGSDWASSRKLRAARSRLSCRTASVWNR